MVTVALERHRYSRPTACLCRTRHSPANRVHRCSSSACLNRPTPLPLSPTPAEAEIPAPADPEIKPPREAASPMQAHRLPDTITPTRTTTATRTTIQNQRTSSTVCSHEGAGDLPRPFVCTRSGFRCRSCHYFPRGCHSDALPGVGSTEESAPLLLEVLHAPQGKSESFYDFADLHHTRRARIFSLVRYEFGRRGA
jgi:hypothetical protein